MTKHPFIAGFCFGLMLLVVMGQGVNWTNKVPNIDVATNAVIHRNLTVGPTNVITELAGKLSLSETNTFASGIAARSIPTANGGNWRTNGTANPATDSSLTGTASVGQGFAQYRGSLTPADAGVTIDFLASTTLNSLVLTGNVTFAVSNMATNRTARLRVINPTAAPCVLTFPAPLDTSTTNWFGGKPTTLSASRVAMWSMECWGTGTGDITCSWSETQ